jgi:tetratricopeptide (TPR) repeat protein
VSTFTVLRTQAWDKKKTGRCRQDLGDLYALQGSMAQALIELRKALLYTIHQLPLLQGIYDFAGNYFDRIRRLSGGLKYGLKAVETAEAVDDSSLQLCTIYNRLGITYFQLKQFQKALSLL